MFKICGPINTVVTLLFQGHQYETVSGFVCEAFGYIPRTGESIKLVLERDDEDDDDDTNGDHQEPKEKKHIFKLEVITLLLSMILSLMVVYYL